MFQLECMPCPHFMSGSLCLYITIVQLYVSRVVVCTCMCTCMCIHGLDLYVILFMDGCNSSPFLGGVMPLCSCNICTVTFH